MKSISFQKWLYSQKNIVGCGSALTIAILYLLGIIDNFWWAIMIGFYIAGYVLTPKEKTTVFIHSASESLVDYKGFLDRLYKNSISQLPKDCGEKLNSIRITAHELIDFLEKDNTSIKGFNENIFKVKKIFDQYLPNLINRYVKLPKRYVENVVLANNKTTQQMLLEQLTILDEQVTKIAYAMYENDTIALQAHGKLLQQKFENEDYFELEKTI